MAFDIGPRIGIEGDKEYKKAISEINSGMRVLKSEMAAVTSEFDKNDKSMEAVTAQNAVLNKQIDLQKQKMAQLEAALKNSAETYGENDSATQRWQIQLNRAQAELNRLERNLDNNNKALSETGDELKDAGDNAEKSGAKFEKLGGILKGVGVAMGAVTVAAGAAAVKLGKEVVAQFGELEQNLGGSEAVFGKYAASIQKTGEDAYKNLGASQSDYLATANKMGALFQGSGIEQRKSLELTEKAMQRAADMASVMGIDMQMALDSVAGAAKGNFTMMDNLGVAMNATNIEAYALAKGLDFTWKSASQAEKAEIAMQMFFENTEQYAGNFARESTDTITGSIGLLKAALGSFTAGLGNANADMANLTGNLVNAFQAVVKNIVPVLKNIVKALPGAIDAIMQAAIDLLPTLLESVTQLFGRVLDGIMKLLPQLIPAVVSAVMTVVNALINNLPMLIDAAVLLVIALVQGLTQALPELIPAAVGAILTVVDGLLGNLPMLIDAAIALITALTDGIINALPMLLKKAPEIIKTLVNGIVNAIPQLVDAAIDIIMSLVDFLIDPDNIYLLVKGSLDIMLAIAGGLIKAIPELIKVIPKIIKRVIDKFKETNWGEIGKNILSGIGAGLLDGVRGVINTVKKVAGNIADGFKDFFGIRSPSRMFRDDVGKMLGFGLAEGIEDSMSRVSRAINAMNNQIVLGATTGSGTNRTTNNYYSYGPGEVRVEVPVDGRVVAGAILPNVSRGLSAETSERSVALG